MKSGGGLLGLLVVAAVLFLPRLLGGGGSDNRLDSGRERRATGDTCAERPRADRLRGQRGRPGVLDRRVPARVRRELRAHDARVLQRPARAPGAAPRRRRPGRSTARPTARCTSTSTSSAAAEPVRRHGDLAAQYIVAHEFGHHVQNLHRSAPAASEQSPGPTTMVDRSRAPGRLLRRRVGPRRTRTDRTGCPCSSRTAEVDEAIDAAAASATTGSSSRRAAASTPTRSPTARRSSGRGGSDRVPDAATRVVRHAHLTRPSCALRLPRSSEPDRRVSADLGGVGQPPNRR